MDKRHNGYTMTQDVT